MKHSGIVRRLLTAAAGLCCALLLTGCWDDAEINGRAFVLGFGMDAAREKGNYSFTFELAIPVSGESDSSGAIRYTLRALTAETPGQAIHALEKDLGRQINFEQLNLILIGEALSREGFAPLTDYFFNRASVRRQSCVAVCEGDAGDFFAACSGQRAVSTIAAIALQSFGDDGDGKSVSMNLHSLFKTVSNGLPFLLLRLSPVGGEEAFVAISGGAVFGGKGNPAGTVTPDELEIIRLMYGCGHEGVLILGAENPACFRVGDSACRVRCLVKDGRPRFEMSLETVLIPDFPGGATAGEETGREAQRELERRLEALAVKFRDEFGVPLPGLQSLLRQRQPDWYDRHSDEAEEICRAAEVTFDVRCSIVEGGIVK